MALAAAEWPWRMGSFVTLEKSLKGLKSQLRWNWSEMTQVKTCESEQGVKGETWRQNKNWIQPVAPQLRLHKLRFKLSTSFSKPCVQCIQPDTIWSNWTSPSWSSRRIFASHKCPVHPTGRSNLLHWTRLADFSLFLWLFGKWMGNLGFEHI